MQKTKTTKLGNKTVTVRELPTRVIWNLFDKKLGDDAGVDKLKDLLQLCCPELGIEDLIADGVYPSEVAQLWKDIEEVNADFLAPVRRIGLIDMLIDGLKPVMAEEMKKAMATLSITSADAYAS